MYEWEANYENKKGGKRKWKELRSKSERKELKKKARREEGKENTNEVREELETEGR